MRVLSQKPELRSARYVDLRCSVSFSDSSLIRYDKLEGRDYLVFPVVMLVGESIIWPANSEYPEYVPIDCLQRSHIASFDSKPVTPYHPQKGNNYVSACRADVYNESRTGQIFGTYLNGLNLGCESWLDIDRARSLGGDAELALEKIENGETIDISVGIFFEAEKVEGELNGEKYGAKWVEIWGDHLALLPASEGACGQGLGCGAPRVAAERERVMVPGTSLIVAQPWADQFSEILALRRHIR